MFLKDPDAELAYQVNWAAALETGVGLAESSWRIDPVETGGLVAGATGMRADAATVRLAGGVPGHVYQVANRVTFSDGSTDERSLVIRVEER